MTMYNNRDYKEFERWVTSNYGARPSDVQEAVLAECKRLKAGPCPVKRSAVLSHALANCRAWLSQKYVSKELLEDPGRILHYSSALYYFGLLAEGKRRQRRNKS